MGPYEPRSEDLWEPAVTKSYKLRAHRVENCQKSTKTCVLKTLKDQNGALKWYEKWVALIHDQSRTTCDEPSEELRDAQLSSTAKAQNQHKGLASLDLDTIKDLLRVIASVSDGIIHARCITTADPHMKLGSIKYFGAPSNNITCDHAADDIEKSLGPVLTQVIREVWAGETLPSPAALRPHILRRAGYIGPLYPHPFYPSTTRGDFLHMHICRSSEIFIWLLATVPAKRISYFAGLMAGITVSHEIGSSRFANSTFTGESRDIEQEGTESELARGTWVMRCPCHIASPDALPQYKSEQKLRSSPGDSTSKAVLKPRATRRTRPQTQRPKMLFVRRYSKSKGHGAVRGIGRVRRTRTPALVQSVWPQHARRERICQERS